MFIFYCLFQMEQHSCILWIYAAVVETHLLKGYTVINKSLKDAILKSTILLFYFAFVPTRMYQKEK